MKQLSTTQRTLVVLRQQLRRLPKEQHLNLQQFLIRQRVRQEKGVFTKVNGTVQDRPYHKVSMVNTGVMVLTATKRDKLQLGMTGNVGQLPYHHHQPQFLSRLHLQDKVVTMKENGICQDRKLIVDLMETAGVMERSAIKVDRSYTGMTGNVAQLSHHHQPQFPLPLQFQTLPLHQDTAVSMKVAYMCLDRKFLVDLMGKVGVM